MSTISEPPPFQEASSCQFCKVSFTAFRRRHHCRCCGKSFCAEHSAHMQTLPQFGLYFNVRLCDDCHSAQQDNLAHKKQESKRPSNTQENKSLLGSSLASSAQEEGTSSTDATTSSSRKSKIKELDIEPEIPTVEEEVEGFECTCGMPLCICEKPNNEGTKPFVGSSKSSDASASAALQNLRIQNKPKPQTKKAEKSTTSNGMPSLFFSAEASSGLAKAGRPKASAKSSYDVSTEGLRDAVKNGDLEAVRDLLSKGIDPKYVDKQGMPLLHLAAMFNHKAIAFSLVDAGADPHLKNAQGETAFDCAPATLSLKLKEKMQRSSGM